MKTTTCFVRGLVGLLCYTFYHISVFIILCSFSYHITQLTYLFFSHGQTLSLRPVIMCSSHEEVPLIRAFACLAVQIFSATYCAGLVLCFCLVVFWRDSLHWARASSFARFLDHTPLRITVGRTPLDE